MVPLSNLHPDAITKVRCAAGLLWSKWFAAADQIVLPAFRLTGSPTKTPVPTHICGLTSPLVYGATAGLVTRRLRKAN